MGKQFHELFINDVDAGLYGVWLEKAPAIPIAPERGTWQTMPGLDGGYFVSDGARDFVDLKLNIYVEPDRDLDRVIDLMMSAERVRVTPWLWEWDVTTKDSAPSFSEWLEIPDEGFVGEVSFKAYPGRRIWPWHGVSRRLSQDETYTINNPYEEVYPLITIYSGTTVTMCGVTMTAKYRDVVINCKDRKITNADFLTITGSRSGSRPVWPFLKHGDTTITVSGGYAEIYAGWCLR